MGLEKWAEYGWLRPEPTSPSEIKGLLGIVERSLADARVEAVSADLRRSCETCSDFEIVLPVQIGDKPGLNRVPSQPLLGQLARCRGVDRKEQTRKLNCLAASAGGLLTTGTLRRRSITPAICLNGNPLS